MDVSKPKVFIGSSSEGLEVAQAIQYQLRNDAQVILWNEGAFSLSHGYLETLVNTLSQFDYGVFVLGNEDSLISRGTQSQVSRGNVLFELGMYFGHLGRNRTFVVYDTNASPSLISDLHGVSFAPYDSGIGMDILSALGPACFFIRQELKKWGSRIKIKKLLILSSNPIDTERIRADIEVRTILLALKSATSLDQISVEQEWAVQGVELAQILLAHRPTILHVACPGDMENGFYFENTEGGTQLVSHSVFKALLKPISDTLECVIFSSCKTDIIASEISSDIKYAIGTNDISEKAAIAFTSGFYTGIGNGSNYHIAYEYGKARVNMVEPDSPSFKIYTHTPS